MDIDSSVWRYYLLSIRPEKTDGNFEWDDFYLKTNNDLVGNFGNLFNRVLNLSFNKFKYKRC